LHAQTSAHLFDSPFSTKPCDHAGVLFFPSEELALADGYCLLAAGYWLMAVESWLLDVGYWVLAIGYWMLAIGCWMVAIGCWLLAAGYWLLAVTDSPRPRGSEQQPHSLMPNCPHFP
jgi:hypothetical protein